MTRFNFNNAHACTIRQFICAAYFSSMLLFGTSLPASELFYTLDLEVRGVSADGTAINGLFQPETGFNGERGIWNPQTGVTTPLPDVGWWNISADGTTVVGHQYDPNDENWDKTSLRMFDFVETLDELAAEHVLLVADSCCSGFLTTRGPNA